MTPVSRGLLPIPELKWLSFKGRQTEFFRFLLAPENTRPRWLQILDEEHMEATLCVTVCPDPGLGGGGVTSVVRKAVLSEQAPPNATLPHFPLVWALKLWDLS